MKLEKLILPLIIYSAVSAQKAPLAKDVVHAIIGCKEKIGYLIKNDDVIETFPVKLGKNGCGKEKEGDGKTPLGTYHIKWIVSKNGICGKGETTLPYQTWCDERGSELIIGLKTPPPNQTSSEKLWLDGYGEDGVIIQLDYPNEEDRKAGKTGSCIQFHGSKHMNRDSLGCVKSYNNIAVKFCQMLDIEKTTVTIKE